MTAEMFLAAPKDMVASEAQAEEGRRQEMCPFRPRVIISKGFLIRLNFKRKTDQMAAWTGTGFRALTRSAGDISARKPRPPALI